MEMCAGAGAFRAVLAGADFQVVECAVYDLDFRRVAVIVVYFDVRF